MKKTIQFGVILVLATAPVVFGGTLTGCTSTGSVTDGSTGFFVQGSCSFYQDPGVYPFDLTAFESSAGSSFLAENYFTSGYLVYTTDASEVTDQTAENTADWKDVLYFQDVDPSTPIGGSTTAILYWGAALTSSLDTTVSNSTLGGGPFFVLDNTGTTTLDGTNVDFTVFDFPTPASGVPEPSTFLMLGGAALALWRVRRRYI
jgi:hypothetical protein